VEEDRIMALNLLFYQLLLISLVLICLIIHVWWPDDPRVTPQTPCKPGKLCRKRSKTPKPFAGLIGSIPDMDVRSTHLRRPDLIRSTQRSRDAK
jgi:hypothetical protein